MSKVLAIPYLLIQNRRNRMAYDECWDITSGGLFTQVNTGTGAGIAMGTNGFLQMTTGATANNISLRGLTNKPFFMTKDCPLFAECRLNWTEASANNANVFFGFTSVPAESLTATPCTPLTSFSGLGFFKQAGTLNWQVFVSNGATQTIVNLTALNSLNKQLVASAGAGSFQVLKIEVTDVTATTADVLFYVDTVLVYKIKGWVWTSSVAMGLTAEVKAGTTASEVVNLDYYHVCQERF